MEVKRREDLLRIKEEYLDRQKSYKRQVLVLSLIHISEPTRRS